MPDHDETRPKAQGEAPADAASPTSPALTAEALLVAEPLPAGARMEPAELSRLYWILRGQRQEARRQDAYWTAMREGLASAYEELERKSAELERARADLATINAELERRVGEQVSEIVARAAEVDALNVRLLAKVQERSRQLLRALQRAGGADEDAFLVAGTEIGGRARIVRKLGDGGAGSVYLALDLLTGGAVALKILRSTDRAALRHFVAEADAANAVPHPAIVKTLHVDVTEDGQVYQLREYIEGATLAQRLRASALTPAVAARVGAAIAHGLAAAHAQGVIHRDIKPANILLSSEGVRIVDFGIAKRAFAADGEHTREHARIGTPAYMSPDQLRSAAHITGATDVYSLGVVLFECVAARRPYDRADLQALSEAHLDGAPQSLHDAREHVPRRFAELVDACLREAPEKRPDAAALADALTALADELGAPAAADIGAHAAALATEEDNTAHGT